MGAWRRWKLRGKLGAHRREQRRRGQELGSWRWGIGGEVSSWGLIGDGGGGEVRGWGLDSGGSSKFGWGFTGRGCSGEVKS